MDNYTCKLCGHEWVSKLGTNTMSVELSAYGPKVVIRPKACPRCKRYDWFKENDK